MDFFVLCQKRMTTLFTTIKSQIVSLFLGALALTVALAWNAAVQNYFRERFPNNASTVNGQFVYAFVLTGIGVGIAYVLLKYVGMDTKAKLF